MSVRVRFAPSPTGHVHIGNIRVAIFNWLFARHEGGEFLVRVEDTDRERSTPEAVQAVFDALAWLGIDHDGEPLYQSSRRDAHLAAARALLDQDAAYLEDKGGTGKGECIVFRMPHEAVTFSDVIKGELRKEAEDLKDLVIVRSNGSPVFHLANVMDDIEMGITHVIRGDDHIENTYRHVALYRALGAAVPRFAHLPMITNEQGKPYSKRDGAAFVGEFRERGYRAEALFNFLALLGWSPGEDRELMTRREMIDLFDLSRVKSGPAKVDPDKLEWMNFEYFRRIPAEEFKTGFRRALQEAGLVAGEPDEGYLDAVIALMRERTKWYADVPAASGFFFTEEYPYDEKACRKRLRKEGVPELLRDVKECLAGAPDFAAQALEQAVRAFAEGKGISASKVVHPVRVAVSGLAVGPGLFEMLSVLGRERVLARLDRTLGMLEGSAG